MLPLPELLVLAGIVLLVVGLVKSKGRLYLAFGAGMFVLGNWILVIR